MSDGTLLTIMFVVIVCILVVVEKAMWNKGICRTCKKGMWKRQSKHWLIGSFYICDNPDCNESFLFMIH